MDPLQSLWDLADKELCEAAPPLQAAPTPFMGTSMTQDNEHPVTQQRRAVDLLRKQGVPPEDAHQQVYGEIDLSDTQAKRDMASTFGRVQDDGNKKAVRIDHDHQHPSILAQDDGLEAMVNQTTVNDLRTPINRQVPDAVQDPEAGLQQQEEYDYNLDVAYLQKYGRA